MDRLQIEISGELPEDEKYAILAEAQSAANELAGRLNVEHNLSLTAEVRSVRPGKSKARTPAEPKPIVAGAVELSGTAAGDDPVDEMVSTSPYRGRHAAE